MAVKLIRSELAGEDDFRARFAREVRAARQVSGAFTAPVIDADPDAPQPWLVTAYIEGPSPGVPFLASWSSLTMPAAMAWLRSRVPCK